MDRCYVRAVTDRGDFEISDVNGILGDFLKAVIEDIEDDFDKVKKILRRAFPEDATDEDVAARLDKLRRTQAEPGIERLINEVEKEGERLQTALRGRHTLYEITVRHDRTKPFESDWVGHCQAVRVTLPERPDEAEPIWTHLGVVKASDHLAFSVQEIREGYAEAFGTSPNIERVDLVTGARHYDIDRFSPISIFLAFEHAADEVPAFYVYESGSAQGNPQKLYWAAQLDSTILDTAGFAFTPFACSDNWYRGRLIMNRSKTEPSIVSINISQEKDGQRHYLTLTASYAVSPPGPVIWPIASQIQAAIRVFAIAQGMGCDLDIFEQGLGLLARGTLDWITTPPLRGQSDGYSGCSQADSTGDPATD